MPKPSASSPRQRSRQHIANTSAHAYSAGRSASGTRPRNCTPALRPAFEPLPVAARARDRELHAARPKPGSVDIASITTSKPLRGTSRGQPEHERAFGIEPEPLPRRGARLRVDRVEPFAVDARRDDHAAQRPPRGVGRGARRIRAGGDDRGRAAQHPPRQQRCCPASARSTVISLPCATTTYGAAASRGPTSRAAASDRGRSRRRAPRARARRCARATRARREQHLLARRARRGTPAARPTPRRPGTGW